MQFYVVEITFRFHGRQLIFAVAELSHICEGGSVSQRFSAKDKTPQSTVMPVDYSKFDSLVDDDDDEPIPPPVSRATGDSHPVFSKSAVSEEHCRSLDDAPPLQLPDGPFLKYYQENMTTPQKMQTLTQLWNSSPEEERVDFVRHLIEVINDPAVSNRIKGGQEILKDLNSEFYQGVTYPVPWVEHFKSEFSVNDKKLIFEKLFKSLSASEQRIVLGTLM